MDSYYTLRDPERVFSPGLLFYRDAIRRNIARAIEMVGGQPARLRPHVKTHKTREIVRMAIAAGITKHKCATLAEAEMLADCGAAEVLIAYPMVGPNTTRVANLVAKYPGTTFAVLGDSRVSLGQLAAAVNAAGQSVEVMLDLDVGQHRTGIAPGPDAVELYELIDRLPGLKPGGIHAYDGHNHQENVAERGAAVEALLGPVLEMRSALAAKGLHVPRLVCGGTPTFPMFAASDIPGLECSPGTFALHDANTQRRFPDLTGFVPAALMLTRVVSKPMPTRLTLDLGTKAVASDPPAGKRVVLLNVPDYEPVLQNEEHFAIDTPQADSFQPGDPVYAVPAHVCPTCALHRQAYVIEDGQVVEMWDIASRDRQLTI